MIREMLKTPEEVVAVYQILMEMHKEAEPIHLPEVDPAKVVNSIRLCAETGKLFVAERDGKIVGALGLLPTEHWFATDTYYADRFFYVLPSYRNSTIATRLLKAAKDFATDEGRELYMAVLSGVEVDRKENFIMRQGFARVGGMYKLA
jgi:GNAT superfamily N-acetyltransferase